MILTVTTALLKLTELAKRLSEVQSKVLPTDQINVLKLQNSLDRAALVKIKMESQIDLENLVNVLTEFVESVETR